MNNEQLIMSKELKILYIITQLPCPARYGVHKRVLNVGLQLRRYGQVQMVYVGREDNYNGQSLSETEAVFGKVICMQPKILSREGIYGRLRYKFNMHWPWYYVEQVSREDKRTFFDMTGGYDVAWFHTLPAADVFGKGQLPGQRLKTVMDLDDINEQKLRLACECASRLRKKLGEWVKAYKWHRREREAMQRFDAVCVCSDADKEYLGGHGNIYVVPNGFEDVKGQHRGGKMQLGFIGSLGYKPNRDALVWFLSEVWPLIRQELPSVRLRVVGSGGQSGGTGNADKQSVGVDWLGYIDDPADEFANWSAMIVPLRIGGGTRLKIIEAFSRGCAVVSTTVGAYGIKVTNGKDILLADNAEDFAWACCKLLRNEEYGNQLATAGRKLYERYYNWDVIGKRIGRVLQSTVISEQ